jgi:phosphoglycolate phosphatase-like HAD superfamily hydrolase
MKNSTIQHICFDLDGTIVDSYQTIYKTTKKTLEFLKIAEPLHEKDFQKKIGHHFLDIFSDLKIPVIDLEEFINIYKGFYFEFIDESVLYEGTENVLNDLKKRDLKISLLTTKAQDQADKIIDHFSLRKYFDLVMGRRENLAIKPAAEPLLKICRELNVDVSKTLMVGDSELDINCGKNAGSKTCAVSYGYRDIETLRLEKPDYIIGTIREINSIL